MAFIGECQPSRYRPRQARPEPGADEFLLDLIDLDQQAVYAQVQRMADAWKNPPGTVDDVLNALEHLGLLGTVAALRG